MPPTGPAAALPVAAPAAPPAAAPDTGPEGAGSDWQALNIPAAKAAAIAAILSLVGIVISV
jgi:hypothetical protein